MLLDLDLSVLSKKFKVNTERIIKSWKAGKTDLEIAKSLGVEQWKLNCIRRELQQARWKKTIGRRGLLKDKAN